MSDKKTSERKGLGRGLSALMADINPAEANAPRRAEQVIAIDRIHPNPDQPRRVFRDEDLDELTESIREKGVIQPLILRPDPVQADHYQIVAGERRWRASQRVPLHEVPAIIRDISDLEMMEIALIENIQRADLNPIEEAEGYALLMSRFGHTQDKLAKALSKSRSHIANTMRLQTLPDEVKGFVSGGQLSAGHARALITAPDPVILAREVISKGLNVRATETLVKRAADRPDRPRKAAPKVEKDADTLALERDLSATLGMRVSIDHKGLDGGQMTIRYRDLDQLDRICQALGGS